MVEQWDTSQDFFLIVDGRVDVLVDGERVAQLGPDEFFGEIAALDWGAGSGIRGSHRWSRSTRSRCSSTRARSSGELVRDRARGRARDPRGGRAPARRALTWSVRALSAVFRNPELRRVELAFVTFNAAEWGTWIAMLVFAYEQGGTTTAGLVALAQLIPAGLCAPFAAVLADRRGPSWMLTVSYVAQAVTMGATAAALFADAEPLLVYAFAAAAATSFTFTRPRRRRSCPALARTPEELTAANVVSSWIESLGIFLAPAAAGVLLGVSGPASVFAVMAVVAAAGGLLTIGLPGPAGAPAAAAGRGEPSPGSASSRATGPRRCWSGCSARSTSRSARSTSSTSCSRSACSGSARGARGT